MAHANRDEGLYIELDSVLDTRLGTISKVSLALAEGLLRSTQYFERDQDIFDGVPVMEYARLWKERNVETLKRSVLTNLISQHVRHVLEQLKYQAMTQPKHDSIRVDINIYPYRLSQEVEAELVRVIEYHLNGGAVPSAEERSLVRVEIIDRRPEAMTPSFCKERYGAMWMYDPGPWLGSQNEAFNTLRIPEVLVYVPKLYHGKKPNEAELSEIRMAVQGRTSDPFTLAEMQLSPIAGVQMLDVSDFSSSVRLSSDPATA